MSSFARAQYEALPPCTPEEIFLAKCPLVEINGDLFILTPKGNISFKETYDKIRKGISVLQTKE